SHRHPGFSQPDTRARRCVPLDPPGFAATVAFAAVSVWAGRLQSVHRIMSVTPLRYPTRGTMSRVGRRRRCGAETVPDVIKYAHLISQSFLIRESVDYVLLANLHRLMERCDRP